MGGASVSCLSTFFSLLPFSPPSYSHNLLHGDGLLCQFVTKAASKILASSLSKWENPIAIARFQPIEGSCFTFLKWNMPKYKKTLTITSRDGPYPIDKANT